MGDTDDFRMRIALCLFAIIVGLSEAAEVNLKYDLGVGWLNPSHEMRFSRQHGYQEVPNPFLGLNLDITLVQGANHFRFGWGATGAEATSTSTPGDSLVSDPLFQAGILLGFGRTIWKQKYLQTLIFLESNFGGFSLGSALSDVQPGKSEGRAINASLGFEQDFRVGFKEKWNFSAGTELKLGTLIFMAGSNELLPYIRTGLVFGLGFCTKTESRVSQ